MKTFVLFKKTVKKAKLLFAFLTFGFVFQAQAQPSSSPELVFENNSLYSGTAGADNAVYLFPSVNSDLDALVKITGRSSSVVRLTSIDITSSGFNKAFQPRVQYNSSILSATTWWMEFEISFVNKGTLVPATINNFNLTGLDIDGNDDNLKEWHTYYNASSYTLETVTQLSVSDMMGTINQPLLAGKQFNGSQAEYPGIDTTATELMTTLAYQNVNKFVVRFGGTTTGAANSANRMYSAYFKSFNYNAPSQTTLPLDLLSFTATLNKTQVDLKWTTIKEINVSHFVVEKSYDGRNFSDAGLVFAFGNTVEKKNYSLSDNVSGVQNGILYYRLRSYDIDGKTQLSETRIIRIGRQKENLTILTYPNPVSSELRITIPNNWQGKDVRFDIFNSNGQLVRTIRNTSASQTENVSVNKLARGLYVVKASQGSETAQQSIIKN